MKDEIKNKLTGAMAGTLSEPVVTYILVKVRELLDIERTGLAQQDPQVKEINLLKAYCDWTVHVDMTFDGRTKPFLKTIDDYLQMNNAATQNANPHKQEMEALYYLEDFRSKLEAFLKREQLPSDLTSDSPRWVEFLKHYAGIIHNRSMRYQGNDLIEVRQMTFTTLAVSNPIYILDLQGKAIPLPFGIQVNITKKDGKTASLSLPDWKLL
jgi:hypothetical protein